MSTLVRQEIELARAELREEATKAGKSIAMFAGAGGAGYFAVLFGLLAAMFGLAEVTATAVAALIVMIPLLLVSIALVLSGRSAARSVHPTPTRTVQTLKEDVQWARSRTR
jgi:4-hydroxybenzoate polyprenyltransferase